MKYSTNLKKFLAEFEAYKKRVLDPVYVEIDKIFHDWENPEYWIKYSVRKSMATPSPVRFVLTRIKHPEKIVNKIFRKPEAFPKELKVHSLKRMHDVIGVRIIVYFSSQLPLIDKELRESKLLKISKKFPPEAYLNQNYLDRLGLSHIQSKNKESGYTSIHYTVSLNDSLVPEEDNPYIEVQVRTLAQELWSELEHIISYKTESRTNVSAKRRLQTLSREISVVDEHFNLLYEELIQNQEVAKYVDSDTLTIENLPKIMAELGVQCIFTELRPILKMFSSRSIMTIKDLVTVATPRRLAIIRNTYISKTGHRPNNIELVSALSELKGAKSKKVEIERIKSQIELHQTSP